MFQRYFAAIVSALCYAAVSEHCQASYPRTDFIHNQIAQFVVEQQQRLPDFLRWPIFALTLAFDVTGLLRRGRLFHQQTPAQRWQQMQAWRRSPLGPCRDLMRFYESLTLFSWYALPASPTFDNRSVPAVRPPRA